MTRSPLRRATFAALAADGHRWTDGPLRVTYLPASHPAAPATTELTLAFALGRRFGSAVERNRARRRIRSAFVECRSPLPGGVALIGARREVLDATFDDLVGAAGRLVARMDDHG